TLNDAWCWPFYDTIQLNDLPQPMINVQDNTTLVDVIPTQTLGTVLLDNYPLPHVQSIRGKETTHTAEIKVTDILSEKEYKGSSGQSFQIMGWTKNLDDLNTLKSFADGNTHQLFLPYGAVVTVNVQQMQRSTDVNEYGFWSWQLDVQENVDG